jgi:hypothetical protein
MGSKPANRLEALLIELCADYGYCLPPSEEAALIAAPPEELEAFVDAVLLAHGEIPELYDQRERHVLREVVRDWLFDEGEGKGSRSGLPRHARATSNRATGVLPE